MRIAVLREDPVVEPRVAATPETVKKFVAAGASVAVEAGCGLAAGISDEQFRSAGAEIAANAGDALRGADLVLKVRRPEGVEGYGSGAAVVALMDPYGNDAALEAAGGSRRSPPSRMELMPRITRAQVMDVLSSAGQPRRLSRRDRRRRAISAAPADDDDRRRHGAGRARLRHGRRRGRPAGHRHGAPARRRRHRHRRAARRQGAGRVARRKIPRRRGRGVQGRRETAGGYAKEMSKEYQAKQAALVAAHIAKQDIVITTALIPGRPAPKLVSRDDGRLDAAGLRHRRPRGRARRQCRGRGRRARSHEADGVKIVGHLNVPGRIAASASALYAKNLYAFVETDDRQGDQSSSQSSATTSSSRRRC